MDLVALLGMVVIVGIMIVGRHWADWMYPWGLLLTSLCAIVLVAFVIRPGSLLGRLLEISPLRWMGQRSYSIYLWHWPVMLALQWEFNFIPNTVAIVAVGLLATFALSELSYRLVEAPMRRPQFWSKERYRRALASPGALATITASMTLAVFLALVVGYTSCPDARPPTCSSQPAPSSPATPPRSSTNPRTSGPPFAQWSPARSRSPIANPRSRSRPPRSQNPNPRSRQIPQPGWLTIRSRSPCRSVHNPSEAKTRHHRRSRPPLSRSWNTRPASTSPGTPSRPAILPTA